MAGNKFRMIKRERKIKFNKRDKIILINDVIVYSKPSDKERYKTKESLKKETRLTNVEDIIEQKDGIYAKIKGEGDTYVYIKLSNGKNEVYAESYIDTNENKNHSSSKIQYSTVGQIRVGDDTLTDVSTSEESSIIENVHKEFIKRSYKLIEKKLSPLLFNNPEKPKNLSDSLENSPLWKTLNQFNGYYLKKDKPKEDIFNIMDNFIKEYKKNKNEIENEIVEYTINYNYEEKKAPDKLNIDNKKDGKMNKDKKNQDESDISELKKDNESKELETKKMIPKNDIPQNSINNNNNNIPLAPSEPVISNNNTNLGLNNSNSSSNHRPLHYQEMSNIINKLLGVKVDITNEVYSKIIYNIYYTVKISLSHSEGIDLQKSFQVRDGVCEKVPKSLYENKGFDPAFYLNIDIFNESISSELNNGKISYQYELNYLKICFSFYSYKEKGFYFDNSLNIEILFHGRDNFDNYEYLFCPVRECIKPEFNYSFYKSIIFQIGLALFPAFRLFKIGSKLIKPLISLLKPAI